MLIGFLCLIIFLFAVYQLSRDDFLFLRKGISTEHVFNVLFLGLPVALFASRLVYAILHPSFRYFNPLIFLIVPYFPGLSLVGGIIGGWIFLKAYTTQKKIPTERLLDIVSIAFLLSFSCGVFMQGVVFLLSNRLLGLSEIGRSMIGIALFMFVLLCFLKNKWQEGIIVYITIIFYSLLAFLSLGFMILFHKNISVSQSIAIGILFIVALIIFLYKENPLHAFLKKK